MKKKVFSSFLILLITCFSVSYAQNIIDFKNAKVRYTGRIGMKGDAAELTWTASSVIVNFTGTSAKATLRDDSGNDRIDIVIDDKVTTTLQPTTEKKEYVLAANLPAGKHKLELFKRTEYDMGRLYFYCLNIDGQLLNPPTYKYRIEFYGNSITCGYAIEDTAGKDRGSAEFENGFKAYANQTARNLNAEVNIIAKSGIGVIISWFNYVMPDIYDRVAANDKQPLWNFKKYTPEVVVVNLFQNDYWLIANAQHEQFKAHFGSTPPTPEFIIKGYQDFISKIRIKYPKATIICALGSMNATEDKSPMPGYIEKAVAGLNDRNIITHFFPYKQTPGHPSAKEQTVMAEDLTAFIKSTMKW
ncbi:SGNH/GDSL hydrolase family protein [Mucilaginibacter glaciei]|uniref:SGNH/GDSL hydrolase family protein n=1 Tax=Mucilaginibacter glaciei TaxID=2772109 RepID=A0A926NUU0_9SPHI|nr:SGNH/GDSL hydrolase family protein [Mucilaginibacter glaciei]MBD1392134.1 SGNH/GDSL hydrolase family protein [Mucilaginibacter glaciei]